MRLSIVSPVSGGAFQICGLWARVDDTECEECRAAERSAGECSDAPASLSLCGSRAPPESLPRLLYGGRMSDCLFRVSRRTVLSALRGALLFEKAAPPGCRRASLAELLNKQTCCRLQKWRGWHRRRWLLRPALHAVVVRVTEGGVKWQRLAGSLAMETRAFDCPEGARRVTARAAGENSPLILCS